MKIRTCFVSNSSSSSFILKTSNDIRIATQNNMKFYKVKDIIIQLKPVIELQKFVTEYWQENGEEKMPSFLIDELYCLPHFKDLAELVEKYGDDVYITSSFDRDIAYERDIYFETFREDL